MCDDVACCEERCVAEEAEVDVGEEFLALVGIVGLCLGYGVDGDDGFALWLDGE